MRSSLAGTLIAGAAIHVLRRVITNRREVALEPYVAPIDTRRFHVHYGFSDLDLKETLATDLSEDEAAEFIFGKYTEYSFDFPYMLNWIYDDWALDDPNNPGMMWWMEPVEAAQVESASSAADCTD